MSTSPTNLENSVQAYTYCGENKTWRNRGRERESPMGVDGKGGRTAELNP